MFLIEVRLAVLWNSCYGWNLFGFGTAHGRDYFFVAYMVLIYVVGTVCMQDSSLRHMQYISQADPEITAQV